ncbi:MAG: pyruvate kinase [Bacteroidetes bacterium]|nr:pyruvate kinase [Bacteroidota bacterium]
MFIIPKKNKLRKNIERKVQGKTKIVCTLGPSTSSEEMIIRMCRAGMDVARLNSSHSNLKEQADLIKKIRRASQITGEPIAILQDLQGPKIRIGFLENKFVELKTGSKFVLTSTELLGNDKIVTISYKKLSKEIEVGNKILLDDGLLQLKVIGVTEKDIVTEVIYGGILKEKKGINLPGVKLNVPAFTEKDLIDLEFGIKNEVDYVALSFVRSANDIKQLKSFIVSKIASGRRLPIIAKIEKIEALQNIDEIIEEADGIMVARGDLGVECELQEVPIAQKLICKKANDSNKPVIIATQMLESMINNPRPTRAEANDVANAVLDGADAVMLSGETSVGNFSIETIKIMESIVRRAEITLDEKFDTTVTENISTSKAIARSACILAKEVDASAIIVITYSGDTACLISRHRPKARIIAITDRQKIMQRLNLIWGIRSVNIKKIKETDKTLEKIYNLLVEQKFVSKGEKVVVTAGIPLLKRGSTNMLKVEQL